jgi:hypothetical protein
MNSDLRNLASLAAFLKKYSDFPFDLLGVVNELKSQISNEFNFELEAKSLSKMNEELGFHLSRSNWLPCQLSKLVSTFQQQVIIAVPQPLWSSRTVLVMTFMEGTPLNRLMQRNDDSSNSTTTPHNVEVEAPTLTKPWQGIPLAMQRVGRFLAARRRERQHWRESWLQSWRGRVRRRTGSQLLTKLAMVWGVMIFEIKTFHADAHPGNILCAGLEVGTASSSSPLATLLTIASSMFGVANLHCQLGLLDWGQTKTLQDATVVNLASLVRAINSNESVDIAEAFLATGIRLKKPTAESNETCVAKTAGSETDEVCRLARAMFDSPPRRLRAMQSPFHPTESDPAATATATATQSIDDDNRPDPRLLQHLPRELFFVVRTIQLFKGMASSLQMDLSVCSIWDSLAKQVLRKHGMRLAGPGGEDRGCCCHGPGERRAVCQMDVEDGFLFAKAVASFPVGLDC